MCLQLCSAALVRYHQRYLVLFGFVMAETYNVLVSLMAKLDVKSAFRLCPVRPKEHHLMGMHWQLHNFTVFAQHLPGKANITADSLSRLNMQEFRAHAPKAAPSSHSQPSLSAPRANMTQYLREALPGLINLCHIQLVFLLLHSLCHHLPLPCTRGGPPPSFREHPHAL